MIKAGYIVIDKEKDMTSFSCVNRVKRLTGLKAGHTGTLDPMAEGVLPVLLGSATKLSGMIMDHEKRYRAGGLFGYSTDTLDITGEKISEMDLSEVSLSLEDFKKILDGFTGRIMQVPPMYSALKKDGRRLYELARKGMEVEREEREIEIHSIDILSYEFPHFVIDVTCSKGTYIRTLIDDIGRRAAIPCVMESLIRTRTGRFTLDRAVKLSEVDETTIHDHIISVEELFLEYDKIVLEEKVLRLLQNGVRIKDRSMISQIPHEGTYRIYDTDGGFIGTAVRETDNLRLEYRV